MSNKNVPPDVFMHFISQSHVQASDFRSTSDIQKLILSAEIRKVSALTEFCNQVCSLRGVLDSTADVFTPFSVDNIACDSLRSGTGSADGSNSCDNSDSVESGGDKYIRDYKEEQCEGDRVAKFLAMTDTAPTLYQSIEILSVLDLARAEQAAADR